ncbi:MAG: preprotein translocase subunit YajC [Gleimia sp.]
MEIIIFAAILLIGMMFLSSRGRKKQEEQIRQMHEQIQPGVWVRTGSGFYGIVSDVDGDVYILQSPNGEESYWDRRAIQMAVEPPFENTDDSDIDEQVPELEALEGSENADTDSVVEESEATEEPVVEASEEADSKQDQPEDAVEDPTEEDPEDLWDDSFAPNDKKSENDK